MFLGLFCLQSCILSSGTQEIGSGRSNLYRGRWSRGCLTSGGGTGALNGHEAVVEEAEGSDGPGGGSGGPGGGSTASSATASSTTASSTTASSTTASSMKFIFRGGCRCNHRWPQPTKQQLM